MAFKAPASAPSRPPAPSGTHIGRLYMLVDMGTQIEEIQGKQKSLRKLRLIWELPNAKETFDPAKGPEPFSINKKFTFSMHEKATLRKFIESWRGKNFATQKEADDFDIEKVLGQPCLLTIIHKTSKQNRVYAEITGVSKLMPGMNCPAQINPSVKYNIEDKTGGAFVKLPEWLRGDILNSTELKGTADPAAGQPGSDNTPPESTEEEPF